MVNYPERLDRTFAALVDPTRRAILARLERENSTSVKELARPFAIKLPAVMKHLDVLDAAGLITRSKAGRTVTVRLSPEPMREAMDWLRRYERFWSASLDRLAAYVESKEAEMQEGSMTSLTLVRRIRARPSIVFDALTTPEGIACWWGPDDGPVLLAETDPRVGGRYRVRFRMLDGSEHESSGEYLEVVRPERLAMSWRWAGGEEDPGESLVEIRLRAIAEGTELTFTHSRLRDEETRRSHEEGWNGALDKLERHFLASA